MKRPLTAREILKLSSQERDRVLEAAANLAYEDYVSDPELTGFEDFGDTTRARSMSLRPPGRICWDKDNPEEPS